MVPAPRSSAHGGRAARATAPARNRAPRDTNSGKLRSARRTTPGNPGKTAPPAQIYLS